MQLAVQLRLRMLRSGCSRVAQGFVRAVHQDPIQPHFKAGFAGPVFSCNPEAKEFGEAVDEVKYARASAR
jgi:hypothetical protein